MQVGILKKEKEKPEKAVGIWWHMGEAFYYPLVWEKSPSISCLEHPMDLCGHPEHIQLTDTPIMVGFWLVLISVWEERKEKRHHHPPPLLYLLRRGKERRRQ